MKNLPARFFTLYPIEPHLHQKEKFERAWGARFGYRAQKNVDLALCARCSMSFIYNLLKAVAG